MLSDDLKIDALDQSQPPEQQNGVGLRSMCKGVGVKGKVTARGRARLDCSLGKLLRLYGESLYSLFWVLSSELVTSICFCSSFGTHDS